MKNSFFLVLVLAALASTQSVLCPDKLTQCDGCQYCPGNQGLCSNCQPADVNKPYTYVGDYKDGSPRAFSKQFPGTSYTPATCYEAAKSSSLTVFGLQYGGECWASNDLSKAEKYGKTNATKTCSADPSFMCGGGMINSVYTLSAPATPDVPAATKAPSAVLAPGQCPPDAKTGANYGCSGCQFCRDGSTCNLCPTADFTSSLYGNVGCFADGTPRAFSKQFSGVLYNAKTCYTVANAAGFIYFALQNGGECWATNSKEDGSQHGKSTQCTTPCTSTPTENCGGRMVNQVYTTVFDNASV